MWWSWTAPSSASVTINTLGSTFNTLLAVYSGTSLEGLSPIISNDNGPYDLSSLVTFNVVAGNTYQIAVDGANGAGGTVQLSIGNNGYTLADMGNMAGFPNSGAYSINLSGVVAGDFMSSSPSYTKHACIWTSAGGIQPLFIGEIESHANAINDNNQVVGYLRKAGLSSTPILWQNGVVTELGGIGTTAWGAATAIDNAGRVIGWLYAPNGSFHAFYWYNGVMKDLGAFGTDRTTAYALNGPNLIVGGSGTYSAGPGPAVMWNNFSLGNLDIFGSTNSGCLGVNSLSQVVGNYYGPNFQHAFLWENGVARDLGSYSSFASSHANAINNLGQIVGDEGYNYAMIWENGSWQKLETLLPAGSGWSSLFLCYDINDRGQIAGAGTINGQTHGFILTPVKPVTPRPFVQNPTNQQHFIVGQEIPVTINLLPDATTVQKVELFQNATLVATSGNAPYNFTWVPGNRGSYLLSARVTSISGGTAFSPAVFVSVANSASFNIEKSAEGISLSWPVEGSTEYEIETTTNLRPPITWEPVTNAVIVSEGIGSTTFSTTNEGRFFRLKTTP